MNEKATSVTEARVLTGEAAAELLASRQSLVATYSLADDQGLTGGQGITSGQGLASAQGLANGKQEGGRGALALTGYLAVETVERDLAALAKAALALLQPVSVEMSMAGIETRKLAVHAAMDRVVRREAFGSYEGRLSDEPVLVPVAADGAYVDDPDQT